MLIIHLKAPFPLIAESCSTHYAAVNPWVGRQRIYTVLGNFFCSYGLIALPFHYISPFALLVPRSSPSGPTDCRLGLWSVLTQSKLPVLPMSLGLASVRLPPGYYLIPIFILLPLSDTNRCHSLRSLCADMQFISMRSHSPSNTAVITLDQEVRLSFNVMSTLSDPLSDN